MEKRLKSPITGGMMTLEWEEREMTFRKEVFKVIFPFYRCHDTGEQFTSTASDGVWLAQLRNQYCQKYGIPYTDEVIGVRKKYGLSSSMMSEILGFGANQWRKYEQEEVPNVSNGRMIRSIMNPNVMLEVLNNARQSICERDYVRIYRKIESVIQNSEQYKQEQYEASRIFSVPRGIENGFAPLSLERLKNLMLFIIDRCGDTWYTKMNKILFYIDFTSYRESGMAISGLQYRAIDFGPVPERFVKIYGEFAEIDNVPRRTGEYDGIVLSSSTRPDITLFTQSEIDVMESVCERFVNFTSSQIAELSHMEPAWKNNIEGHRIIDYSYAFSLVTF